MMRLLSFAKPWVNLRNLAVLFYVISIVALSIHLNTLGKSIFFSWAAFLGWLFFFRRKSAPESSTPWDIRWLIIPFFILFFTRAYLYFKYSGFPPLGYDMGIYKYEFEHARTFTEALKTSFYPGLILLVALLQKIGFSIDFLMRDFYIFLNLAVGVMVYFTARDFFGKKPAFLAFVFYVVSTAQFNAYYFFLYKNILALPFLLGGLMLLRRRSYWAIPVAVVLGVIQPPDFLIFGMAMLFNFLYRFKDAHERRYFLTVGLIILGLFLLAFLGRFEQIVEGLRLILTGGQGDKVIRAGGSFMTFRIYVGQYFHVIPFILLGILAPLYSKESETAPQTQTKLAPLYSAFLTSCAFVLFKIIFYKRYIIEMDLFASIFAGVGAFHLIHYFSSKLWQKMMWAILVLFFLVVIVWRTTITIFLLPPHEAMQIEKLCDLPEDALVMSTHAFYSAWLRGYSCHEVIAPLSFELNRWDERGWQDFRSGDKEKIQNRMKELAIYKKPIYIFIGQVEGYMDFDGIPGFTRIAPYVWRWYDETTP